MKIEELKLNYPQKFVYLERYVNQKDYSKFCNYTEVSEKYTPRKGVSSFNLLSIREAPDKIILNSRNKKVSRIKKEKVFFIHPDSGYYFDSYESNFIVSPTASTRTVLVYDFFGSPIFVKLSLPKRISRFTRELEAGSVKHSLKVSSEIRDFCSKSKNFGCLHEIAGAIYKNVGCIFREFEPSPKRGLSYLVPLFSLYSYDYKKPKEPLLIKQISDLTDMKIKEIIEWVLKNIIDFWSKVILEKGLLLEMHGQNTLIEFDKNFEFKRIVVRDFCSVRIDPTIRESLNLKNKFKKKIIGVNSNFDREKEYSLVYDFLIAHHLLVPLLRICSKKFRLSFDKLKKFAVEIFSENFEGNPSFFPQNCYGYTDEIFVNKKPRLKVFGRKPLFRPS